MEALRHCFPEPVVFAALSPCLSGRVARSHFGTACACLACLCADSAPLLPPPRTAVAGRLCALACLYIVAFAQVVAVSPVRFRSANVVRQVPGIAGDTETNDAISGYRLYSTVME